MDVRGVFLDISKTFDEVWHKEHVYKLKQNGISGDLLSTLIDFLTCLNWQCSSWVNVETGVPQGSILQPLMFLIYLLHYLKTIC